MQTLLDLPGMPPRVAVISARPMVGSFFSALVRESGFELTGCYSNPSRARAGVEGTRPDVAVTDIAAGEAWFECAAAIAANSMTRVLLLTQAGGDYVFHRAVDAGVRGLISEDDGTETMIQGLQVVAKGGDFVSPTINRRRAELKIMPVLTNAELRILPLVCKGMTDGAIAAALGVAPRTVETQRCGILRKLGLQDVGGLYAMGIRLGVVTPGEIDLAPSERRSAARGRAA